MAIKLRFASRSLRVGKCHGCLCKNCIKKKEKKGGEAENRN